MNKVMLIGNVGKNPEIRYFEGNSKVATIRLATTEETVSREGDRKEYTEWHTVIAWRNNACFVEEHVKKGALLYVEGRLRSRTWNDRTGNPRYSTEIHADNLQLLGRPEPQQKPDNGTRDAQAPGNKTEMDIDIDDDLPF